MLGDRLGRAYRFAPAWHADGLANRGLGDRRVERARGAARVRARVGPSPKRVAAAGGGLRLHDLSRRGRVRERTRAAALGFPVRMPVCRACPRARRSRDSGAGSAGAGAGGRTLPAARERRQHRKREKDDEPPSGRWTPRGAWVCLVHAAEHRHLLKRTTRAAAPAPAASARREGRSARARQIAGPEWRACRMAGGRRPTVIGADLALRALKHH